MVQRRVTKMMKYEDFHTRGIEASRRFTRRDDDLIPAFSIITGVGNKKFFLLDGRQQSEREPKAALTQT